MSRADIDETCSCGATLHVVMDSLSWAVDETAQWRKDHRHEPAPQPEAEPEPECHDTTLDAYVERPGVFDRDKDAEMDARTDRTIPGANPIGFRP